MNPNPQSLTPFLPPQSLTPFLPPANGVQPKVEFNATVFGPIVGTQSLTKNTSGTVYTVGSGLGGGSSIAGGMLFPILGSPGAPSTWSFSGVGGDALMIGITINMDGLMPTYINGFIGVGFGGSGKIDASGSADLFQSTIKDNGDTENQWIWHD